LSGGLALLLLAWRGWRLPPFPGQIEFTCSQLGAAWWSIAASIENMAAALTAKVFWAEMAWPGIIGTPLFGAMFAWAYCKGEDRFRTRGSAILSITALGVVWAMALSNDWHGLIYLSTTPASDAPGAPVIYGHGPLFYVIIVALYLLMLFSLVTVADTAQRAPRLYRRHYFGFALALLFPWIANIGHLTGTIMPFGFDATPFSFILTGVVFYWLISRRQLFVLLPIGLRPLLDSLPDAVMVLNDQGHVVEANAAAALLAAPHALVGKCLTEVLPIPIPETEESADGNREIGIRSDHGGERQFEVRIRRLSYKTRSIGRVIVLTDITHRKTIEHRLTEQLARNQALQMKLREQANRDLLTGLHNRHFLEEVRPALLAEAASRPLTAVMIDLDHFKSLNDSWGHLVGDEVLRNVARFLETHARQNDIIIRTGGEEILILLPDTEEPLAAAVVERWRASFAAQPITARDRTLMVTFSAGIASFPGPDASWDDMIQRADQALYRAKDQGRNRICRWEDEGEEALAE